MGANNTARALGLQWGLLVWLLDGLKGVLALLVARQVSPPVSSSASMILGAIAVVLGHSWSLFATLITGRVRGGKGAATASGTWLLLISPLIIALVLMLWAAILVLTRYVSLAVLTCVTVVSAVMVGMVVLKEADQIYVAYTLVTLMIFLRHRANIRALLQGTERRFGDRA
jgi:glycerol-3-phosphate acyltransferase PlsY